MGGSVKACAVRLVQYLAVPASTGRQLRHVVQAVEDAQSRGLQVVDWAVQNASLEDVFIEIARSANAQSQDLKA